MTDQVHRVAIIGCGRMGQYYAHVYSELPNTEIVAIAEYNDDRRRAVGERFGVKALYKDVSSLLDKVVPDIAAIITPTKWFKEAVIACAEAGVGAGAAVLAGAARPTSRSPPGSPTPTRWWGRAASAASSIPAATCSGRYRRFRKQLGGSAPATTAP